MFLPIRAGPGGYGGLAGGGRRNVDYMAHSRDRPAGSARGAVNPLTRPRRQERHMNLTFAVERLLETGWTALGESSPDHLPDGRPFPSVTAVRREFDRAGLRL